MKDNDLLALQEFFNERVDRLEERLEERFSSHFSECQKLCGATINNVRENTNKAHERLDKHASSIKCLDKFKNRVYGALGMIGIILTIIGTKVW